MKKKLSATIIFFIVIVVCMSMLTACFGSGSLSGGSLSGGNDDNSAQKPEFASGSGSESDPYIIEKDYQWSNIAKHPDAFFEISADINLGDYKTVAPIGNSETPFSGTIDGKNHTISGATIRANHNAALFGITSGATISNLKLANSSVALQKDYSDGEYMSSFVAIARKGTHIENCSVDNVSISWSSKTSYFVMVGGFVGSLESVSSVVCCSTNVKISLNEGNWLYPGFYVGGFARLVSGSTIDCCSASGSMTFGHYAGSYVMQIGTIVDRVINSDITNMCVEMNINVGPSIDVYTIAGTVDNEPSIKYCMNFSSYQRATQGRYKKCDIISNASEDVNIYFSSSQYAYANDTLDRSIWQDNEFWKKGKVHPELISYSAYLELKNE